MKAKPKAPLNQVKPPARERRLLLKAIVTFVMVFCGGELLHYLSRDQVAPILIGELTVPTAGWLVQYLSPELPVQVVGNVIKTAGMRFVVAQGCEGLESMLLVCAAMLAVPMRSWQKLVGIVAGTLVLWVTNQARIVGLFFVQSRTPEWFDTAHILVGQTLVVFVGVAFFMFWINTFLKRANGSRS